MNHDEINELFRQEVGKIAGARRCVHVGGHQGEESDWYDGPCDIYTVLWVEANPFVFPALEAAIKGRRDQRAVLALVSDTTGRKQDFHVLSNGHSSSMLTPKDHLNVYPHVREITTLTLNTITLDDLLALESARAAYNVLCLDTQGAEAHVLRGATKMLEWVKVIHTEINLRELYEGCVLVDDLDRLLDERGFFRRHTVTDEAGWGEAIYLRKT